MEDVVDPNGGGSGGPGVAGDERASCELGLVHLGEKVELGEYRCRGGHLVSDEPEDGVVEIGGILEVAEELGQLGVEGRGKLESAFSGEGGWRERSVRGRVAELAVCFAIVPGSVHEGETEVLIGGLHDDGGIAGEPAEEESLFEGEIVAIAEAKRGLNSVGE